MKWGKKELWNFSLGLGKFSYSSFDLVLYFFSFGFGRRDLINGRTLLCAILWKRESPRNKIKSEFEQYRQNSNNERIRKTDIQEIAKKSEDGVGVKPVVVERRSGLGAPSTPFEPQSLPDRGAGRRGACCSSFQCFSGFLS